MLPFGSVRERQPCPSRVTAFTRARKGCNTSTCRKALIDILYEGQGVVGGAMLPPPEGLWGMPEGMLKALPGYDAELDTVDTTNWYPKIMRKDYSVGLNITEAEVDDPDPQFYENYVCGAQRNYSGYCNPETDKLVDRQSIETDQRRRKQLVWDIERKLAEDDARPILFSGRIATCWQPQVKGLTLMVNSIYNGARFEDLWLEK